MSPQSYRRTTARRRCRPSRALAAHYLNLRRVWRALPKAYLVLKPDAPRFTIVEATDSYLRLTNASRTGIIGRGLFDVLPVPVYGARTASDPELRDSLTRVCRSRSPDMMTVRKFYVRTPGGATEERYWTRINTPVLDQDNRVLRIVHAVEDVTEAVRLAHKTGRVERAAQVKSAFLARMSHELRTPLNAIGGYVQLLELGLPGPLTNKQREYLTKIRHSEEHLLTLIDEVLDLTRAEAGRTEYALCRVDIAQTLAAVEELTAPQLQSGGLHYQAEVADARLAAYADADKVRRIVTNLVTNAIKNTDSGGSIRVSCAATADLVSVHVADTGHGIEAEQLEKIFEPFVQLPGSSVAGARGFGLGLSICRELARGMGGDILVESKPGHGSTFTLLLRRYRVHGAAAASRAETKPENAADD